MGKAMGGSMHYRGGQPGEAEWSKVGKKIESFLKKQRGIRGIREKRTEESEKKNESGRTRKAEGNVTLFNKTEN